MSIQTLHALLNPIEARHCERLIDPDLDVFVLVSLPCLKQSVLRLARASKAGSVLECDGERSQGLNFKPQSVKLLFRRDRRKDGVNKLDGLERVSLAHRGLVWAISLEQAS